MMPALAVAASPIHDQVLLLRPAVQIEADLLRVGLNIPQARNPVIGPGHHKRRLRPRPMGSHQRKRHAPGLDRCCHCRQGTAIPGPI
jgi:hypothetical protein